MIPNITTGSDFGGLIDYLVVNRDHEVLDLQGVTTTELAPDEMAAVANLSDRAKVKLIHLSLSAAHEDRELAAAKWLSAVDHHETVFGLAGHQRVVVRHKDKTHDHVHVFWCTISMHTGKTPPKRWFLRKGFAQDGIGPHALSDEQVARVPVTDRARRTYDFLLLRRAQHLCRSLEREFGLRQLRTPEKAAADRAAVQSRAPSSGQQKRAERTGATPLIERAEEIRIALNESDWPSKQRALSAIGLGLEPFFRTTKNGSEIRGLMIFDQYDPGNRMKASQLDTAQIKYGLRRLEERHSAGALSLERWWPERDATPFSSRHQGKAPPPALKADFDLLVYQHRQSEAEKRAKLRKLRQKQKLELAAKRRALMARRAKEAANLPASKRRSFYATFSKTVRSPELATLVASHQAQAAGLARSKKPTWREFVTFSAKAGSMNAMRVLTAESVRQEIGRGHESEVQHQRIAPVLQQPAAPAQVHAPQTKAAASLSDEDLVKAFNDYRARGRE